jgi:hypothetical protein
MEKEQFMTEEYVVRYRTTDAFGNLALIVTDRQGTAYLYAAGALQFRAADDETGERMIGRLGTPERWESLATDKVYALDALARLAGAADSGGAVCAYFNKGEALGN